MPTLRKYAAEVAEMRAQPGRWVLLAQTGSRGAASSRQQRLQRGCLTVFRPAEAFQSVTRGCRIYARYLGDQPDDHTRPARLKTSEETNR
jgi:hypothetical protein